MDMHSYVETLALGSYLADIAVPVHRQVLTVGRGIFAKRLQLFKCAGFGDKPLTHGEEKERPRRASLSQPLLDRRLERADNIDAKNYTNMNSCTLIFLHYDIWSIARSA
jgi:hypothetical protein